MTELGAPRLDGAKHAPNSGLPTRPKGPSTQFSEHHEDPKPILKLVLEESLPASAATSLTVASHFGGLSSLALSRTCRPIMGLRPRCGAVLQVYRILMESLGKVESRLFGNWVCLDHKVPERQLPV